MEEHKPTGRELKLGRGPERPEEPGPGALVIPETVPKAVVEGMVLVPAGEFIMGSGDRDRGASYDEKPQRRVYLDAYYIDIYQVTNGCFREFVRETRYRAQGRWKKYAKPGRDDHPVVYVTWYDAVEYCNWRSRREGLKEAYDRNYNLITRGPGYRLPTEAGWEKAARGEDGRIYPWGNEWDSKRCNCWDSGPHTTTPVGSYPSGVSPYGCHDLAGNVWEWCHDWYDRDYYKHAPNRNPMGPERGEYRVLRGGSVLPRGIVGCSFRLSYNPEHWWYNYGFRCCLPA